jgi:hypothetical protein
MPLRNISRTYRDFLRKINKFSSWQGMWQGKKKGRAMAGPACGSHQSDWLIKPS